MYKYNRLSYGIASAPAVFQSKMESVLEDIECVAVYFDDIFVSGKTREAHDRNLRKVLERLVKHGLTVRKGKCVFAKESISFLGYELSEQGVHISQEKIDAIVNMKAPENVAELQSFLGVLTFFSHFIRNYAEIVSPLYELLRSDVKWQWTPERKEAFENAKKHLVSRDTLVHYNPDLPIKITFNASPRGLGAVLFHVFPNNEQKPIAYASRVFTRAEQNYSQLDREALALVFGVKKFHQYVYGRKFQLETDHKPLTYIFGPKKGIPQMATNCVQRWAIFLAGYDFDISHIKGKDNSPADALSRVLNEIKSEHHQIEPDEYTYLNFICENTNIINESVVRDSARPIVKNSN